MGERAGAVLISQEAETLDALLWRAIGDVAGAEEATLAANPGLAALGPVLPAGTVVTLPASALRPAAAPLVQLWD